MEDRFGSLNPYRKRNFVPDQARLVHIDEVIGLFQQILQRSMDSQEALEQTILDLSELSAALGQRASILYINMTCDTQDQLKAKAYQQFVEQIEPAIKPIVHQINEKLLKAFLKFSLSKERYEIYCRSVETAVKLFDKRNVDLSTQIALLSQEYQTISGSMSVYFQGEEKTLPQMSKFLLENDRSLRQKAWEAVALRRLQDKEKIDELFDKMKELRIQIAQNAGCKDFIEYQFKAYQRFDYTSQQCKEYHRTIKEKVLPLKKKMNQWRKEKMGLTSLRPWDIAVDPLNRPMLKPFDKIETLISGVGQIVKNLDIQLYGFFQEMVSMRLLDLESRKGKAPGGYQNTLTEARKPFIFMNAVGVDDDVRTLLHELGHAFHACLSAEDDLDDYRHAPMEFCEVASMSMELMSDQGMKVFYSQQDASRSSLEHLEGVISILCWVAVVDAFQHWIYENPKASKEDRRLAWLNIYQDFGDDGVDWNGLEEQKSYLWHRQLHIFEVPFYYIEYGIAQLGALQIWNQYKKDPIKTLENYKRALALGGSRPLPVLFETAGIKFDFSQEIIEPLMKDVYKFWEELKEK